MQEEFRENIEDPGLAEMDNRTVSQSQSPQLVEILKLKEGLGPNIKSRVCRELELL